MRLTHGTGVPLIVISSVIVVVGIYQASMAMSGRSLRDRDVLVAINVTGPGI